MDGHNITVYIQGVSKNVYTLCKLIKWDVSTAIKSFCTISIANEHRKHIPFHLLSQFSLKHLYRPPKLVKIYINFLCKTCKNIYFQYTFSSNDKRMSAMINACFACNISDIEVLVLMLWASFTMTSGTRFVTQLLSKYHFSGARCSLERYKKYRVGLTADVENSRCQ